MTRIEKAKTFIAEVTKLGHTPSINGEWVLFTPPLPPEKIMESMDFAPYLTEAVRSVEASK